MRHNWVEIRRRYVEGIDDQGVRRYPTYEDVAKIFEVGAKMMRKRAGPAREDWAAQRAMFQAKLSAAQRDKKIATLAGIGAEFDTKALRIADALLQQVAAQLTASAIAKTALGPKVIHTLTAAAKASHVMGRLAMGDSTENLGHSGSLDVRRDLSKLSLVELEQLRGLLEKAPPVADP